MSKYTTITIVNGKEYRKEHKVWMQAFMDASDIINHLRFKPAFYESETTIAITITDADNKLAATYNKDGGWCFA